jgi:DNA invertase Pin-like site-specific DNA recombinase
VYGYHRLARKKSAVEQPTLAHTIFSGICDGKGNRLTEIFVDGAWTASTFWLHRPEGCRLDSVLHAGDEVLVARGASILTSIDHLVSVAKDWYQRGITLHILDSVLSFSPDKADFLIRTLESFAAFKRTTRSEAIRLGMALRKQQGKRCGLYAGYGHRWKHGMRVPVPSEQEVIARIVDLREGKGLSWNAIAVHLLHSRTMTDSGQEWSVARVRRAYAHATKNGRLQDCGAV